MSYQNVPDGQDVQVGAADIDIQVKPEGPDHHELT